MGPAGAGAEQGGFQAFLLHGVTGSGKTEIYLRAIEEVVRQGKEALVLVPEISLTPQTIQRFRGRCGEVAVLHSHLGDAERGGHWRRVAAGQVQVVVGARSAVFAPTRKLGLIVIDEEHESSFKQEATPRYHARDVAVMRARLENIPILLGSATPSLESWHNAQRGQYTLLTLPKRVLDRPLPQVGLIDLRHEPPRRGRPSGHQRRRWNARCARRSSDGGQVILLLNRRGFSTHVHCPACGHVEIVPLLRPGADVSPASATSCSATTAATSRSRRSNCPQCGQAAVRYQGLGTEKLQAEIEERFPATSCAAWTATRCSKPGSHARVLDAFRDGLIHILLGTQMIAKGLDFPNVTLVGVVNADVGLHMPDFRAAERTFQLLAQVAGRAGRGPRGGQVLVQTFTPEHPCIALAATHDYAGFVGRRDGAPPAAQLSAVSAAGPPHRPQPRPAGGGGVRRAAGRRLPAQRCKRWPRRRRRRCACSARPRRRCSGSRATIAFTSSCNRRAPACCIRCCGPCCRPSGRRQAWSSRWTSIRSTCCKAVIS